MVGVRLQRRPLDPRPRQARAIPLIPFYFILAATGEAYEVYGEGTRRPGGKRCGL